MVYLFLSYDVSTTLFYHLFSLASVYVYPIFFKIILDIDEERLYWITYDKGELKSASSRGNDVQQVILTNSKINNYALRVHRSYILYGSDTKLMKLNKKPGSIPTELYNDKNAINSIYVGKKSLVFI